MKKKIARWILIAVAAGGAISYAALRPVREFVDGLVSSFGLGGEREGVTYWCPMHPEIIRKNPGTCPV